MTLLHPTDAARSFPGLALQGAAQSGQALRQRTARPLSEERLTDMSKRTDKLGFVAPQATEFEHRLTAWKSAVVASNALKSPADQSVEAADIYDAELARIVTAEDAAAEALVATPAETAEQVALKVDAIYRRWVGGASLAEPETRRQVASWSSDGQQTTTDMAQCLLALYLDLTGLPAPELPKRPPARVAETAFSTLFAAHEAAEAEENEALRLERETGQQLDDDELDRLQGARLSALWSLMLEPAPDLDSLAWKLARSIDIAHADYVGDSADNPETISRLLSGRAWDDGFIPAVAYQDVLRLAGRHGPITEAKPDDFDPKSFLSDVEERTGAGITLTETGSPAIAATDKGASGNLLAAAQSWTALSPARRGQVQDHLMGVSR